MSQIRVLQDGGWRLCDIVGLGRDGSLWGVNVPVETEVSVPAAFVADFESGIIPSQFNVHTNAELGSAYAHSGSYGCRLTPDPNTGICSLTSSGGNFPGGRRWVSFSMWFRLVTAPSPTEAYMNLFELGNALTSAPKSQFTMFFNKGRLTADFNANEQFDIAATPSIGTWHKIEVRVDFGATSYSSKIRYDGGTVLTFNSGSGKIATTSSVLWIHYPSGAGVDYVSDYDEIKLTTSDTDPGWLT